MPIPSIDFGPYFASEEGALEHVAAEIARACEQVGIFYARNHGVSDGLIERAFAAAWQFFSLPLEQKLAAKLNRYHVGYLPIGASVQAGSTVRPAIIASCSESLFVKYDRELDHPSGLAQRAALGSCKPFPRGMRSLRDDSIAYLDSLGSMCQRMLPAFAVALGMPADFFVPYFAGEADRVLRILHYPPRNLAGSNVPGHPPHTDNSFITALARTEVPGLMVRLPCGEWFPPPVIPGTLLINIGNIMRLWSNDRFLSVPHAVKISGTDRYSLAYFHNPSPDRVIKSLPSCVGPAEPARYPPAVCRDLSGYSVARNLDETTR